MLTADLVRARRTGGKLELIALSPAARERAVGLARAYIDAAKACVGATRRELDEALGRVPVEARDRKLSAGLQKLVSDRCEIEAESGSDPVELRRAVFTRASAARRSLGTGERFAADTLLATVAGEMEMEPAALERLLYVDLRSAHRVLAFASLSPEALVELYSLGQAQAVLLRARHVIARVYSRSPGTYRAIFHKLKFLRLLYSITEIADGDDMDTDGHGYQLAIDGPYSLFRSVTRYGLKLALLLPALRACDAWTIEAEVEWGNDRRPLSFVLSGGSAAKAETRITTRATTNATGAPSNPDEPVLAEDVATLLERFSARDGHWRARPATDLLHLPGVGVCVPDIVFEHQQTGACAYLEVLGFWSRAAVWKRVELIERGLPHHIVFAVSSRLRVSEAALGPDLPGALYVYKGAMSARAIEERLDAVVATRST